VKFRRKELSRNADQNCNCNVLYGCEDAENSAKVIKNGGNDYFEWIKLEKGIYLKFYPSGHVLGGAIAVIKVEDAKQDGEPYYIAFSGDLGGDDKLFLSPLVPPDEPIDFWLVESTYGGMSHPSKASEIDQMADLIVRAERESMKILNASFALEKSQEMIFLFSHLVHEEIVPKIPAFLDAPLAKNYTEAYAKFWPTSNFIGQSRIPFNPFNLQANPYFHAVEDSEGSVELSRRVGPCFVIAGSGDAEAGRIRGHYRENISSPKTQIWKTGWAPDDTLNGKLGKKYAFVRMNGVEFPVKAEVHEFLGMSSHRDGKNTAILTARMFDGGERKGIIAIVHGELARAWALKRDLVDMLGKGWNDNIILPNLYEVINIG